MITKARIRQVFFEFVERQEIDGELKRSMRQHTTVNRFVDNVAKELDVAMKLVAQRRGRQLNYLTVKNMVEDFARVLLTQIKTICDRRSESDLARIARERELQNQKDLEATVSGTPSGEYAENIKVIV